LSAIALLALGACATATPGNVVAPPLRGTALAPVLSSGEPVAADAAVARAAALQDRDRAHQPWEFTVAGSGASDQHFNAGCAGLNASLGYYFNEVFELSVRQTVNFADAGAGSGDVWNFGSFAAIDFDSHSTIGNSFDDGTIYYNIGLGARF
jgi:hypothetical protein